VGLGGEEHPARIAFERDLLRKMRTGISEPASAKQVLEAMVIAHLVER
jgi:hypothetical protein